MKYGIISDIHSNIHAYKAAVDILEGAVDKIVCLGDIVGYNANPKECIEFTKSHKKITYVIKGNHDKMAHSGLRFSEIMGLSKDAYDGLVYTIDNIDESDEEWLYNLKDYALVRSKTTPFLAVHGTPVRHDPYGYILSNWEALKSAAAISSSWKPNICFFGHTHVPTFISVKEEKINDAPLRHMTFKMGGDIVDAFDNLESVTFDISDPDSIYLINPGSIGQPRVFGIHSFVIIDTKSKQVHFECFDYDREAAIKAIRDAGYSDKIAERLER